MSKVQPPAGIEIAALRRKGESGGTFNLLAPGSGVPWEDRAGGSVSAYFKTVIACMFAPNRALMEIRRPESTRDANIYLWISCAFWGVGFALMFAIWNLKYPAPEAEGVFPWATTGAILLGMPFVTFGLLLLTQRVYTVFAGAEHKSTLPKTLMRNLFAYAMSPSLLAVIPFAGPVLAVGWSMAILMFPAGRRLNLKASGSITASIVSFISIIVAATAVFFILDGAFVLYSRMVT